MLDDSGSFVGTGGADVKRPTGSWALYEQAKLIPLEHTDIIRKDNRETLYGHKICLTGGASSMILDCKVLEGNPADSTLAKTMVDRQVEIFSRPPRQIVFDGGFASKMNLSDLKAAGVQDFAFSKGRGLEISDMVKSSWVFKRLRDFRAGIEGNISF